MHGRAQGARTQRAIVRKDDCTGPANARDQLSAVGLFCGRPAARLATWPAAAQLAWTAYILWSIYSGNCMANPGSRATAGPPPRLPASGGSGGKPRRCAGFLLPARLSHGVSGAPTFPGATFLLSYHQTAWRNSSPSTPLLGLTRRSSPVGAKRLAHGVRSLARSHSARATAPARSTALPRGRVVTACSAGRLLRSCVLEFNTQHSYIYSSSCAAPRSRATPV